MKLLTDTIVLAGSNSELNFSIPSTTTSYAVGVVVIGNAFDVDMIPESLPIVKSSRGSSSLDPVGDDSSEYLMMLLLPLSKSTACRRKHRVCSFF